MIAAIYARKSTDEPGKDTDAKSVTRQIEQARAYAERKGWTVRPEHVYSDDGISGAEFQKRPGLARLLAALDQKRCPFHVLIMSEESRLGREQIETSYVLKQLTDAGVRVFLYLDDRERTLDSAMDKVMLSLTNFGAELEREKASQRRYDTMVRKARAGKVTGGKVYGYQNVREASGVKRVIHEPEAAVVRRIFELYADGIGMLTIAHRLNGEGVKPPRGRGWAPSGIREMLHRPLYRGEIVWGKHQKIVRAGTKALRAKPKDDWLVLPAPDLRIVSEELHARVQARLDQVQAAYPRGAGKRLMGRPRFQDESHYLLTGFIRCGACGGPMGVDLRLSGPVGSKTVAHYVCLDAKRRGPSVCSNRISIKNAVLDPMILKAVTEVLNRDVLSEAVDLALKELTNGATEARARRAEVEREIVATDSRIAKLVDSLLDESLPRDILRARLTEEQVRKAALTAERDRLVGALAFEGTDADRLKAALWAKAQDIVAVLGRQTPQARQMLRKLLADKIELEAVGMKGKKNRGYRFRGALTVDKLIGGEAFADAGLQDTCTAVVTPAGFEPAISTLKGSRPWPG